MHGARQAGGMALFIDRSTRRVRRQVHNLSIAIVLLLGMAYWGGWAALDLLWRAWEKRTPR